MRLSLILVTFDSVQSAQRAKASLNGADIYSGCCTLKIEYAKVSLEVATPCQIPGELGLADVKLCLIPAAYTLERVQERSGYLGLHKPQPQWTR